MLWCNSKKPGQRAVSFAFVEVAQAHIVFYPPRRRDRSKDPFKLATPDDVYGRGPGAGWVFRIEAAERRSPQVLRGRDLLHGRSGGRVACRALAVVEVWAVADAIEKDSFKCNHSCSATVPSMVLSTTVSGQTEPHSGGS